MAEHPIIYSTEMVRAVLDGRKTKTRRIIKPQPEFRQNKIVGKDVWCWDIYVWGATGLSPNILSIVDKCPYGKVGDTLWVREALYCDEKGYFGRYKADNKPIGGELPLVWCWKTKHLSGRFMPKIQARIFLEITNITRVERVQDITPRDCVVEGIELIYGNRGLSPGAGYRDYSGAVEACGATASFRTLWDSLNAKRGYGWDKNPWVWVIEFKRTERK